MSNKVKFSTILGVAGATVLAAGGSAFVTDTGLALVNKNQAAVQETEAVPVEKETEALLTVEAFTATKDAFTIKPVSAAVKKDKTTETEKKDAAAEGTQTGTSQTGSSSGGSAEGTIKYDENGGYYDTDGLYHDEWGGYYAANGDYYDGQGGYYDGSGYHRVDGSSSSGSSSGYSGGWDDSYILYDASQRYLTESDLKGWSSYELAILRNEIFARHGRIFQTQEWRDYFSTKSWYVPQYSNVDDMLNDYEWRNIDLILRLEDARS